MGLLSGRRKWLLLASVLIIVLTIYLIFGGGDDHKTELATVKMGDVQQVVSVTGTVEADPEIQLRFQSAGAISSVLVGVGEKVEKGRIIAELENTEERIRRDEAAANLRLAEANLQLKRAGATVEDIAVSKAAVDSAIASLDASRRDLENIRNRVEEDIRKSEIAVADAGSTLESRIKSLTTAESAYDSTEATYRQNLNNAVINSRNSAEQALITIQTSLTEADNILGINNSDYNDDYEDYLGASNSATRINAENSYKDAKVQFDLLSIYFKETIEQETTEELIFDLLNRANMANAVSQRALSDTFTMLEFTLTSTPFTPEVLSTKKSLIDTAKKNLITSAAAIETARQNIIAAKLSITNQLNTQQSALETARLNKESAGNNLSTAKNGLIQANLKKKSDIDSAESNLKLREAEYNQANATYNLKIAAARSVDLAGLEAQVQQATAALNLAENQLEKTRLKSPAAGVIANIYFEVGENVLATDVFVRMIASQKRIIANVSEVDITKIHLDDHINITLDALPLDRVFAAVITEIDPAETQIQGVVYYQIRSLFNEEPEEVKPGMTANLEILASEKKDVLIIPTRAVKYSDLGKYVEVWINKETVEKRNIITGLEGDLYSEILKGLEAGEMVVTYGNNGG